MPIRFHCPECQVVLYAESERSGVQIVCPQCKQSIVVPQPKLGIFLGASAPIEKDWRTEPPPMQSMPVPQPKLGILLGASEKDWLTEPPPAQHSHQALANPTQPPQSDANGPIRHRLPADPRTNGLSNRIVVAGTLTVSSLVFIVIGLMPSNQFTQRGIISLVAGLCLAVGGIASLFLIRPRRSRLQTQSLITPKYANGWYFGGVAVLLAAILMAAMSLSRDSNNQGKPAIDNETKQQVAAIPLDQPKKPNSSGPEEIIPLPKPKIENAPRVENPLSIENPPKVHGARPNADSDGPFDGKLEPKSKPKEPRGFKTIDSDSQPPPQPIGLVPEEQADPRLLGKWRTSWKWTIHDCGKEWTFIDGGLMTSRQIQNSNYLSSQVLRWAASGESLALRKPDADKLYFRFKFVNGDSIEVTPLGVAPEPGQRFPMIFVRVK